jgi:hypothetical protein
MMRCGNANCTELEEAMDHSTDNYDRPGITRRRNHLILVGGDGQVAAVFERLPAVTPPRNVPPIWVVVAAAASRGDLEAADLFRDVVLG